MKRPPVHPEIRLGWAALGAGGLLLALLWGGVSRLRAAGVSAASAQEPSGRSASEAPPEPEGPVGEARGTISYREGSGVLSIFGSGLIRAVPCPSRGSRQVWIEGRSLRIRLTGSCRKVVVAGEGNEVRIHDVTDLRELEVHGRGHRLESGPLGQTFPTLRSSGEGHRFEGGLAGLSSERPTAERSDD